MDLFSPLRLGAYELKNRIVMAPMARARCDDNRVPTVMMGDYYSQRVSAGLIITEASSVSPLSVSRPHASAIYGADHAAGWRQVAEAVHTAGGLIFQQIYHLGRKSDPSRMPDGLAPVAPSAIAAKGSVKGLNGPVDFAVPRALETGEIPGVVAEFRAGAENSRRAGMDGVEIHGANAYLVDQFLRDGANKRDDAYGGSVVNRSRFMAEVVSAAIDVFGPDRVGIRLSPHVVADGICDSDPAALYAHAANVLNELGVAYIHLIEATLPGAAQAPPAGSRPIMEVMREHYKGPLIVNNSYDKQRAMDVIASGKADAVAFAVPYIANPDLVERLRRDAPLNPGDDTTYHNGGAKGYTDYPFLQDPG